MVIIWGTRLYGQTDYIPTLDIYVGTEYFHLWYIPLIPYQSWIVTGESDDGWQGIDIGLHFKSVLLGWLRAGLLLCGAALTVVGVATLAKEPGAGAGLLAVGLLMLAAMIGSYYVTYTGYASYDAAREMAAQMGFTPEGMLLVELAYGNLTEAQAGRLMPAPVHDDYPQQSSYDQPQQYPGYAPPNPQSGSWNDPYGQPPPRY